MVPSVILLNSIKYDNEWLSNLALFNYFHRIFDFHSWDALNLFKLFVNAYLFRLLLRTQKVRGISCYPCLQFLS